MAICQARALTEYINGWWAYQNEETDEFDQDFPVDNIITDDRGENWTAKESEFVESLRSAYGKPDQGPIVASRLVLLKSDKFRPLYLLQLRRTAWTIEYELMGGGELSGYRSSDSTWVVSFWGKDVYLLREADELAPLASAGRNLIAQNVDCARLKRKLENDERG
ncbi:MAG TPA: hypothetical protein PKD99_07805 [Sphingopyxis sp.]|nr:hypothetical protein [Sphingopyxis sp.]HMP44994.1 hypothetical protein [Sphingopyxis sp.]